MYTAVSACAPPRYCYFFSRPPPRVHYYRLTLALSNAVFTYSPLYASSSLSPYTTFISFSRAAYACHSILITVRSARELEVCVVGVRPTSWCGREADLGQPTTHTSGVPALERAGRAPLFIMLSTCLKCAWLVCGRRVGGGREAGPPPPPPLPSSSSH